jgi:hypothetical protein
VFIQTNPVTQEPPAIQLTYRGQAYEVSATPAVDAIATVETATFLGRPYARKQFTVIQRHQAADLTYRGVHYAR